MKQTSIFLLLAGLLSVTISFSQIHNWSGAMSPSSYDMEVKSTKTDASGNIYSTGILNMTVDFDMTVGVSNLTNTGSNDVYIAKYSPSGTLLFAKQIGGPGSIDPIIVTDMVLDNSSNIYITGYFMGTTDFDPGSGTFSLTATGYDIFFAKYNSSGVFQWVKRLGSSMSEYGNTIDLDDSGNIYITGDFTGTLDFDPNAGTQNMIAISSSDIFLAKYSSTGAYIWSKKIGITSNNYSWYATVDNNSNLIFSGQVYGTPDFDAGAGTAYITGQYFLAKYTTDGNFVWAIDASSFAMGLTSDVDNDIYYIGPNNVCKYDENSTPVWDFTLSTINKFIGFDDLDNIILTGYFNNDLDLDPGAGEYMITASGTGQGFIASYDPNGELIFGNALTGTLNSKILFGEISGNNLLIAGDLKGDMDMDFEPPVELISRTYVSGFFASYSLFEGFDSQPTNSTICEFEGTSFTCNANGVGLSYQWQVNDGGGWVDIVDDAIYSGANTTELTMSGSEYYMNGYQFQCLASNIYDSEISNSVTLIVNPLPDIDLGEDVELCDGETIVLDPGTGTYSYLWNEGSVSQTITVSEPGFYDVVVTNTISGCELSDGINVTYRLPFAGEEICMVTVDTLTGNNLIVWEKTLGENIYYYKVYRESTVMGVYDSIGYRYFDEMSVWVDDGVDPSAQAYFYKITVVDSCNNESSLDSCTAHKTIHLQVSPGSPSGYELDWDEYLGFVYPSYKIYRANVGGSFSLVHTISASLTAWTDVSAPAIPLEYRVAVDKGLACYPSGLGKDISGPYSQSVSNLDDNGIDVNVLENNTIEVSVYPNPSNNYLNVELNNNNEVGFEIINSLGQIVLFGELKGNVSSINISSLVKGQYYLRIATDKNIMNESFIVE